MSALNSQRAPSHDDTAAWLGKLDDVHAQPSWRLSTWSNHENPLSPHESGDRRSALIAEFNAAKMKAKDSTCTVLGTRATEPANSLASRGTSPQSLRLTLRGGRNG